jgi:hypothetical protein
MAISKAARIGIVETGMFLGVVLALFTVPKSTPLTVFLAASVLIFLVGNLLLFRAFKKHEPKAKGSQNETNRRLSRAMILIAVCWVLWLLLKWAENW